MNTVAHPGDSEDDGPKVRSDLRSNRKRKPQRTQRCTEEPGGFNRASLNVLAALRDATA